MVASLDGVYKPRFIKRVKLPAFAVPLPCGQPEAVESYIEGFIDPTELLIKRPASTFFVRVKGDSMNEDGIYPGDWLVVDRSIEATEGKIIVAIVDNELTIKRFQRKGRCIWLVPSNEKYNPIKVCKGQDFEVWGVVMWTLHKHN
jgi:DNA polymerase V